MQSDPVTHTGETGLVEMVEVKEGKQRERITGVSQTKIESKTEVQTAEGSINTVERKKGKRFTPRNILGQYKKKTLPLCRLAV